MLKGSQNAGIDVYHYFIVTLTLLHYLKHQTLNVIFSN